MANRLRKLREDKNYSQEDMAKKAGVSQATWSLWEEKTPKQFEALKKLVKEFVVSADYLLGLTDDPRPVAVLQMDPALQDLIRQAFDELAALPVRDQQMAIRLLRTMRQVEAEDSEIQKPRIIGE